MYSRQHELPLLATLLFITSVRWTVLDGALPEFGSLRRAQLVRAPLYTKMNTIDS